MTDTQQDRLSAWRTLLSTSPRLGEPEVDNVYILYCLDTLWNKLFSPRTLVYVTDVGHGRVGGRTGDRLPIDSLSEPQIAVHGKTVECKTQDAFATCVRGEQSCLRMISLVRKISLQPFLISSEGIVDIMDKYKIERPFLDMFFGLRGQSELSEKGCSLWSSCSNSNRTLLCYQFRYRERNLRAPKFEGWSERQVGVYHEIIHDASKPSTMIVLHAKDKTVARSKLEAKLEKSNSDGCQSILNLELHLILLSSYIDNWRWYLDELGHSILADENKIVTEDLIRPYTISFPFLQKLRDTEADLTAASASLKSTLRLIKTIKEIATTVLQIYGGSVSDDIITEGLARMHLRCEGYHAGIEVLSERVSKLIQLVADGLSHKNQINNANISTSLYQLTKKSVDDNVVIRVVTIITLIYLPTQLVATFFGMNFTVFQNSSLVFASNWWWFLATALPLTVVTLAAVGLAMLVEQNKRHNRPPLSLRAFFQRATIPALLPIKSG